MQQFGRAAALAILATLFTFRPAAAQSQTPPALTLGEQRTLVMLVNFQDNAIQPYTVEYARDVVFGRTSDFILENSHGQAWLAGDVVGWFSLPISASVCDIAAMTTLANQAATDAGIDLTRYSRYVYGYPGHYCGVAGFALDSTKAGVGGSFPLFAVAHELGHLFGLGHSGARHCDGDPLGNNCRSGELADPIDVMASGEEGHFNAYHKERLGWLNYGASPSLTTVQASGTYAIEPLESLGAGAKAVKIFRSRDPATGERSWYYVEVRRALGFDSFLPGATNALDGVLIRVARDLSTTSYLLDMTPDTLDYSDSALPAGRTFTDDQAGISITPLSVSDAGATIEVTLGPGACTPGTPGLKLSSQSTAVAPGSTVPYTLTLANTDSSACPASSFNLTSAVPAGWRAVFGSPSLTASPGASTSTTLQVTSSSAAAVGTYNVTAQGADAARTVTASAPYAVAAPLVIAASSSSPSYATGSEAIIAASVYKAGLPVAGATVTFKITAPNGKTSSAKASTDANGAATYVYNLRRKPAGNYRVVATVSVGGSSVAGSTTFNVY